MSSSSQEAAEWHLIINGVQHDAITLSQVYECIDTNVLKPDDLVWHRTFTEWVPASQVFEFNSAPSAPMPLPQRSSGRSSPPQQAKARESGKRWYQETSNIIGALSLLASIIVGALSVPFLTDYWQQNLMGGPLDGYRNANAKTFLAAYNGEWCAEGTAPGIPARMRVADDNAGKIRFEFGNIVAPMSIPGRTVEAQFIKISEGTAKRLLTDGKSAFYVEFENEIFAGIVTYEQFYREGVKNLWRRYYVKDNKPEIVFQASLERCPN